MACLLSALGAGETVFYRPDSGRVSTRKGAESNRKSVDERGGRRTRNIADTGQPRRTSSDTNTADDGGIAL